MSTLFLTDRWMHPLAGFTHGTAQRMRLFLKAASRLGRPLDLLLLHSAEEDCSDAALQALRDDLLHLWGVPVREIFTLEFATAVRRPSGLWNDYFAPALQVTRQPRFAGMGSASLAAALARVVALACPSLLFVHRLPSMIPALSLGGERPPIVFDLDDIEHKAFARMLSLPPHWGAKSLMRLWVPAIRSLEARAVRASRATFVCSKPDAQELNRLFGTQTVHAVPNAVRVPPLQPLPDSKTLLFLGTYDYAPNLHAAEHLVHEIWPRVRQRHPEARLLIGGRAHTAIRGSSTPLPGVEFLGFVEDLDALYAQTRVVACPIRSGGGTRIKIIEAALHGRPVVSTTLGAEGLELEPANSEIVIADDAPSFADAIARLFESLSRSRDIGAAARARALALYDEVPVAARIAEVLAQVQAPASAGGTTRV